MAELNELANANAELNDKVDDLSKPENEAELNKALTDELGQQEGDQPADKTPQDQPEDTSKADDGDKPEDAAKTDDKGDPNPSDDKGEGKKPNKFKELLEEKNEAKESAIDAETKLQQSEKRISDLEQEIADLKSGNDGEGDSSADDDTPLTKKEVEKILSERESAEQQKAAAEKTRVAEVEALKGNKDFPNADEFGDQILEMMGKKNVSAKVAYYAMKGAGIITGDDASASSNANKLNTGDKTKANLMQDKKPSDMSDEELEKAAAKELAQSENIF